MPNATTSFPGPGSFGTNSARISEMMAMAAPPRKTAAGETSQMKPNATGITIAAM